MRTALEAITTTEARLAVSVGGVVFAVLLGYVLAPFAVRRSIAVVHRVLDARDVAGRLESVEAVDHVAPAPKPEVIPTEVGDSAIALECRFWTQPPNVRAKWQATGGLPRGQGGLRPRGNCDTLSAVPTQ